MEKGKVLLVDDDESILKVLSRQLASENYTALQAKSAREALAILAKEPVDVVISDLRMPVVYGGSFLKIVKHHFPDIIRIILTGYPDLDSAMQAINEAGAFKYLTKPLSAKDLFSALEQAMMERNSRVKKREILEGIFEDTESQEAFKRQASLN